MFSVTQSSSGPALFQNYLTNVGAFTDSASYYGTFDQSGNVGEWNDLTGAADSTRGFRDGSWQQSAPFISSADRSTADPSTEGFGGGFRLASPVPEPSSYPMALAGLACGGYSMWRRRKRA